MAAGPGDIPQDGWALPTWSRSPEFTDQDITVAELIGSVKNIDKVIVFLVLIVGVG